MWDNVLLRDDSWQLSICLGLSPSLFVSSLELFVLFSFFFMHQWNAFVLFASLLLTTSHKQDDKQLFRLFTFYETSNKQVSHPIWCASASAKYQKLQIFLSMKGATDSSLNIIWFASTNKVAPSCRCNAFHQLRAWWSINSAICCRQHKFTQNNLEFEGN